LGRGGFYGKVGNEANLEKKEALSRKFRLKPYSKQNKARSEGSSPWNKANRAPSKLEEKGTRMGKKREIERGLQERQRMVALKSKRGEENLSYSPGGGKDSCQKRGEKETIRSRGLRGAIGPGRGSCAPTIKNGGGISTRGVTQGESRKIS